MSINATNPAEDHIRAVDTDDELTISVNKDGPGEAYAEAIVEFIDVIQNNEEIHVFTEEPSDD